MYPPLSSVIAVCACASDVEVAITVTPASFSPDLESVTEPWIAPVVCDCAWATVGERREPPTVMAPRTPAMISLLFMTDSDQIAVVKLMTNGVGAA